MHQFRRTSDLPHAARRLRELRGANSRLDHRNVVQERRARTPSILVLCMQLVDPDLWWVTRVWRQLRQHEICELEDIFRCYWGPDYLRWGAGVRSPA